MVGSKAIPPYHAVGNRLTETTAKGETANTYDTANRLTSINGQAVQWDDNGREAPLRRRSLPPKRGNMLADGQAVYKYNTANKLVGVAKGTSNIVYAYSGLGDRLKQIADGVTTDYTLDINAGLTQVLDDGTNKYVYGNQRISQIAETQTGYFLPDALGSMRQMTDASADLTLARTYDPYGNVVSSSGAGETVYGYTGEMQSGGLVHLRARDYASQLGRFTSRDTWEGNYKNPISFNKWIYTSKNPIIQTDHKGMQDDCKDEDQNGICDQNGLIDIENFNEKIKPPQIEFYPTRNSLQNGARGLEKGKNEAQRLYFNNVDQRNLCGLIVLTAIINSKNPGIDAFQVLYDYNKGIEGLVNQTLGPGKLRQFSELPYYKDVISIDPGISYLSELPFQNNTEDSSLYYDDRNGKKEIINILSDFTNSDSIPIALVQINKSTGKLVNRSTVNHWVAITGFSKFDFSPSNSYYDYYSQSNWVRIYNPFDNETEYYPWKYFRESWRSAGNVTVIAKAKQKINTFSGCPE